MSFDLDSDLNQQRLQLLDEIVEKNDYIGFPYHNICRYQDKLSPRDLLYKKFQSELSKIESIFEISSDIDTEFTAVKEKLIVLYTAKYQEDLLELPALVIPSHDTSLSDLIKIVRSIIPMTNDFIDKINDRFIYLLGIIKHVLNPQLESVQCKYEDVKHRAWNFCIYKIVDPITPAYESGIFSLFVKALFFRCLMFNNPIDPLEIEHFISAIHHDCNRSFNSVSDLTMDGQSIFHNLLWINHIKQIVDDFTPVELKPTDGYSYFDQESIPTPVQLSDHLYSKLSQIHFRVLNEKFRKNSLATVEIMHSQMLAESNSKKALSECSTDLDIKEKHYHEDVETRGSIKYDFKPMGEAMAEIQHLRGGQLHNLFNLIGARWIEDHRVSRSRTREDINLYTVIEAIAYNHSEFRDHFFIDSNAILLNDEEFRLFSIMFNSLGYKVE